MTKRMADASQMDNELYILHSYEINSVSNMMP
jgi:hypothetical protein